VPILMDLILNDTLFQEKQSALAEHGLDPFCALR
jgi:hypothetical protein